MGRHAITKTIQMSPLEMVPKIQVWVFSVKEVFHKDIPIISGSASDSPSNNKLRAQRQVLNYSSTHPFQIIGRSDFIRSIDFVTHLDIPYV
jgi:hypothetical protein